MEALSTFEQLRNENLVRNAEFMISIGLNEVKPRVPIPLTGNLFDNVI